jgi:hypothetical protein
MLKIKKQIFNSVLISASSQKELGDTMMRFQEYYENPFWKDKIFTIGQFNQWYSKKYGASTYSSDWAGYNFPGVVLEPFKKGLFDPLTKKEKILLNLLRYRTDDFYIIGANNEDVLKHELCHALYYSNKNYRKEINLYLSKNKSKVKKIFDYILKLGYSNKVLFDETQAYIMDGDHLEEQGIETPKEIVLKIKNIYKKYSKCKL